uniref:Receptor protein serine/threonine kinase n=1 Tax=Opuntia streptacantha TaxID=393608 RepID=A0A7C9AYH7_OPUST
MCLQGDAAARPPIGDVVIALSLLADKAYNPNPNAKYDTRVKEVGGSGLKWDLEKLEGLGSNGTWKARRARTLLETLRAHCMAAWRKRILLETPPRCSIVMQT